MSNNTKDRTKKAALGALTAITLLVILYVLLRLVASWRQGYSWAEMDWDQSGSTTIMEAISASDIGKRNTQGNGQSCVEYYSYKDGLPVKVTCPGPK